ncbi:MAG: hypothetical protein APF76_06420 [Desulfitibacter sp. BRH_c19]|nr:MAG: hypothetical protein APF76_06420 [Desulfitibacter sp. BRH_c19]
MKKLEVVGLKKSFGNVIANDSVNFDLNKGEVHCILGENGAGKTTMMNCIYGIYPLDDGEIFYEGQKFTVHSVNESIKKGIGMVHQHFMLVHNMTVLENIMLGLKSAKAPFLDKKNVSLELKKLMSKYQIGLDLDQEIRNLSVGSQQSVEILKVLYRESSLLILDEPTAVLTPSETKKLFEFIKQYVKQGNSVVLITHKLEEILDISHRITVMRAGKNVGTYERKDIKDKKELASKMVGEIIDLKLKNSSQRPSEQVPALRVKNLLVKDNRGLDVVRDVSFDIYKGEILGIAGVSGNGQNELTEALAGIRKLDGGNITIGDKKIVKHNSREMQKNKVRYIPEDRHRYGLILSFSVKDNLLLSRYYEEPYSTQGKLNHSYNLSYAENKVKEFNVITPSVDVPAENLSGGNQQKLILARELAFQPDVLIATQPTRGLDVSAAKFVQKCIIKQKEMGTAVLYVSTELDEIIDMSDRIIVMYNGRIVGTFNSSSANIGEIGALMAGNIQTTAIENIEGGTGS